MAKKTTKVENPIIEAELVETKPVPEEVRNQLVNLSAKSLSSFKEEEQKEILQLANAIDITHFDKIMSYGSIPLVKIFEQSGKVLKEFEGTSADREVINLVVELAKKASDTQEEFNLCIQEPGFITKLLLKVMGNLKDKNDAKAKHKAVSCYKLLVELRESCDAWIESLKDTREKIILSAESDRDTCYEIEEYIVAGYIAEEREIPHVEALREEWETTGLMEAKATYETHKRGLENLQRKLVNLEKSRIMNILSVSELGLELVTTENTLMAIKDQKEHSMAVSSQQLRNAVINMKNKQIAESQKSISKLNDELMDKVSQNIALTAEESEKLLLNGVYSPEAAHAAIMTVKNACETITRVHSEMMPQIKQQQEQLNALVAELGPIVNDIKMEKTSDSQVKVTTSSRKAKLTF